MRQSNTLPPLPPLFSSDETLWSRHQGDQTGVVVLKVKHSDIIRATLADHTGNTGFLGFAPDGSSYHVVVPVDSQIARGIKAGNRPDDGTPFGGYREWHYFQCEPHEGDSSAEREARAHANAAVLRAWAATQNIELEILE